MSWQWAVPGIRNEFLYKKFKELMDGGATGAEGETFLFQHLGPWPYKTEPYWVAYKQETK